MRRNAMVGRRRAMGLALWFAGTVLVAIPVGAAGPVAPPVGSWATYQWTSGLTAEVPILTREATASDQAAWTVTREAAVPPPLFVTYGVVRGDAKSYVLQIVTRQSLEGHALSVTQVTVDRESGKTLRSVIQRPKGLIATPENGIRPFRQAAQPGAEEVVAVSAGRFTAIKSAYRGGTVWVSDAVPAMGLVKAVFPNGQLELVRSGNTGARDLIRP